MDWIRENKPLAAILGVILVGTLALGYLLYDSWSSYEETKEGYIGLGNQMAALKGARLAPTDANLQAKKQMVDEYAADVNKLGAALLILQPKVEPMKDIEFQAKLKTKISEIRTAAQSKMQLPADFAFGFDEYTSSLPTSAAAATELSGYLDAMDELVKMLLKCNVQSLDLLERSKLALEAKAAANAPAGGAAAQRQGAAEILEKRQISLILTLDQGALQLLVSRLATTEMPFFTSVRQLRIENQLQEGPLRSSVRLPATNGPKMGGGQAAAASEEVASDEIRPPAPAPIDTIPVFGNELLKVRMEIDLVKFLDAAKGVAAQIPAGR
ncbi:Amuc_1100 family pilus-like protein [Prosthecobacter vanneervenii]|uniref:Uncharacterized protein n=1 Tax=Prosthecobacter vanneervenii TaxID=48466 RepID=A0A7W8DL41_9BACT|nr:Amuc_1100 family pilus-like protein [Prosthecobacter vanneervenii]MBB5033471.1 hypothetical protein [Prosthecobacter vanneervenii]